PSEETSARSSRHTPWLSAPPFPRPSSATCSSYPPVDAVRDHQALAVEVPELRQPMGVGFFSWPWMRSSRIESEDAVLALGVVIHDKAGVRVDHRGRPEEG